MFIPDVIFHCPAIAHAAEIELTSKVQMKVVYSNRHKWQE